MDDLQRQINTLGSRMDDLGKSAAIPRAVETAFRERLGITDDTTAVEAFPVGSLFFTTLSAATNPLAILGYGTWSAYGSGQVLVGYKSGDADFGTVGATGGEKTHVLTVPEIPSHNHAIDPFFHGAGGNNESNGGGTAPSVNPFTGSTGGGGSHNNLQPFIVVNIWTRTA